MVTTVTLHLRDVSLTTSQVSRNTEINLKGVAAAGVDRICPNCGRPSIEASGHSQDTGLTEQTTWRGSWGKERHTPPSSAALCSEQSPVSPQGLGTRGDGVGLPLSSGLEPPRKAEHGYSRGDPVASHARTVALALWTMSSPGHAYMARSKTQATCKAFSLTIFLSCKNKGRTPQTGGGKKTGTSVAPFSPCASPFVSHMVLSHTPCRPLTPCPGGSLAPWGLGSLVPSSGLLSTAERLPGLVPGSLLPGHHWHGDGSLSVYRFSSSGQSSEEGPPTRRGPGQGAVPGWWPLLGLVPSL